LVEYALGGLGGGSSIGVDGRGNGGSGGGKSSGQAGGRGGSGVLIVRYPLERV
jgi:hypothetical protein